MKITKEMKAKFEKDYADAIASVSDANGVDLGVAKDMLISTVKGHFGLKFTDGAGEHVFTAYPGVPAGFDYETCFRDNEKIEKTIG